MSIPLKAPSFIITYAFLLKKRHVIFKRVSKIYRRGELIMKVEIWSDYVCPFCYMGKTAFEEALDKFPQKEQLDIEFKSYQLEVNTCHQGKK